MNHLHKEDQGETTNPEKNLNQSEKQDGKGRSLNIDEFRSLLDASKSSSEGKESIETPLELLGFEVLKKLYLRASPIKADKVISREYIDGYGGNMKRANGVSVDFNFYYTINQVRINAHEGLRKLKERNRVPQGLLSTSMTDGKGFRRDKIYDVTTKTLTINEYKNNNFSVKTNSESTQDEEVITKWLNQTKENLGSMYG